MHLEGSGPLCFPGRAAITVDIRDRPETIVLQFKDPVGMVEWFAQAT